MNEIKVFKSLTETLSIFKEIKTKNFFSNYNEDIFVLENIRFYEEEEKNGTSFAKQLASLGDLFVNDAFSLS